MMGSGVRVPPSASPPDQGLSPSLCSLVRPPAAYGVHGTSFGLASGQDRRLRARAPGRVVALEDPRVVHLAHVDGCPPWAATSSIVRPFPSPLPEIGSPHCSNEA